LYIVGSEYKDSASDPNRQQFIPRRPRSNDGEATQLRAGNYASNDDGSFEEFSYREHATSPLEMQQASPNSQESAQAGQQPGAAYQPYPPTSANGQSAPGAALTARPWQSQPQNYPAQQYQVPQQYQRPGRPAYQGYAGAPSAAGQNSYGPQVQQPVQGQSGQSPNYGQYGYQQQFGQPAYAPQMQTWPGQGNNHPPQAMYVPGYPGVQGGNANNGYYYPAYYYPPYYYPTYGYPNYYPAPARRKRDTYLFTMAIISTVCSSIVLVTGLLCTLVLALVALAAGVSTSASTGPEALFGGIVLFTALALAGLIGGGFGLFHSINALARRRSREFKLPRSGIFLGLYIILLIIGFVVRGSEQVIADIPLSIFLIALAGLLPALTILAFTVRRLHYPKRERWPTTWRRFSIALISGATSAILIALILEEILGLIVQLGLNLTSFNLNNITNVPNDPRAILYLFLVASVIAPLVEETAKPLAIIALIGRINSAAEALFLGMACGIGFDLIETTGYISEGYRNWVDVAVERSTAGLLHGFGAGMTALGWYFITHRNSLKNRRVLIGIGCIVYAIIQHAIWNASSLLVLLPAPIGPFLNNGQIMIGSYPLQSILLVYLVISILILTFLIFVTGKLSGRPGRRGGKRPVGGVVTEQKQQVEASRAIGSTGLVNGNGSASMGVNSGQLVPQQPSQPQAPSEAPRGS
jgi:RsiW-degrading membrane proteinase PrsW (M82 family)